MADASRLVKAIQRAAKIPENEKVDLVTGTVTSVNPLKIKIGKIELTESFLVVGALCKATTIKIPKRDASEDALPDILLWRGLQVGDEVYMIRFSDGQKYYVLQRKEGIT